MHGLKVNNIFFSLRSQRKGLLGWSRIAIQSKHLETSSKTSAGHTRETKPVNWTQQSHYSGLTVRLSHSAPDKRAIIFALSPHTIKCPLFPVLCCWLSSKKKGPQAVSQGNERTKHLSHTRGTGQKKRKKQLFLPICQELFFFRLNRKEKTHKPCEKLVSAHQPASCELPPEVVERGSKWEEWRGHAKKGAKHGTWVTVRPQASKLGKNENEKH